MSLDVNNVFLTVDEDMVAVNDPDEVGSFSPTYNASLAAIVTAIPGVDPTADFTTTQVAAQDNFFTFSANTKSLQWSQSNGDPFPTLAGEGVDSGLQTVGGATIYLFQSSSPDVIYGAVANDPTADAAFVLVIDEQLTGTDVTNAKLWIIQYAALLHDGTGGDNTDYRDLAEKVFVSSTTTSTAVFSDFTDVPAGSPIFAMIADDTNQNPVDFLVTGFVADDPNTVPNESLTPKPINISNQSSFRGSLASGGSQNLNPGTGLRFDTVLNGDNTYTQSEGQSDTNIDFDEHVPVTQAGFTCVQNQGGRPTDLNVQAWNSDSPLADGHAFMTSLGNQTAVGVDRVKVTVIDTAGNVVQTITDTTTTNAFVTFNGDGSVTVKNALLNWTIEIFQDATFNRFTVTNVDSQKNAYVDIGRLTFTSTTTTPDVDEVGSKIQIEDSLPTISAVDATPDTLSVDDDTIGTPASAVFASLFTKAFGSDGPAASGATVYSLSTAGGNSGVFDTASGLQVQLKLAGGVVHGYVTLSGVDTDVFTVSVNTGTGEVTLTQQRAIKHTDTGTPTDASQDPTNLVGTDLIGLVATVKDKDNDTASATADITQALEFKDSQPAITVPASPGGSAGDPLVVSNAAGQSATGDFGFNVGPDQPGQYGSGVSDFVDANAGVAGVQLSLSGTVTGPPSSAITNTNVTLQTETASSAVFNFSFDYDGDPIAAGVQTASASGTLTFDKVNDEYTVAITSPVQGFSFSVLHTSELLAKQPTGNTGHPPIVVEKLAADDPGTVGVDEDFYVQFTSDTVPLGFSTTGDVAGSADKTFTGADHDLAGGVETWVSATQTTNGVAGDTIGKEELLTLRFFNSDILGDVATGTEKTDPTATADGIVLKFDNISGNEDMILILDLIDPSKALNDPTREITRAVIVEHGDIFQNGDGVPAPYNTEFSLDNNDGLVIVENNDYNAAGEHYEIQGVQIMQGPNGLTGQGINLIRAVGPNGGSSATSNLQAFDGAIVDTLKIVDIGFVQSVSGTQDAHLDFSFQIKDADGDLTATQHLFVDFLTA